MGTGCSNDRYSFLRENHGTHLRQLIVAAKARQFTHKNIAKLKEHVTNYAQQKK